MDAVEAVGDELARRLVQLRGQLHAGSARADDGDLQLRRLQRTMLGVRAYAGVDEPAMKAGGVARGFQSDGVLTHARRAEVVGLAADGDHERVVGEGARRRHLAALVVGEARHVHEALPAIQADHLADAIAEVVPVRLRQIVQLVRAQVHAAGGDLVQQRLPQMGAALVDEGDVRALALAELVAQARGQLQSASAAADDDDAVQAVRRCDDELRRRCRRAVRGGRRARAPRSGWQRRIFRGPVHAWAKDTRIRRRDGVGAPARVQRRPDGCGRHRRSSVPCRRPRAVPCAAPGCARRKRPGGCRTRCDCALP